MDTVSQKTTKVEGKKKSWPLSEKEVAEREANLRRDLTIVGKKREKLSTKQLRLTEVKETIRQTELGQEQEELKSAVKELELQIATLATGIEKTTREVLDRCTTDPQTELPATAAPAPKASAAERTLPLLPAKPKDDIIDAEIVDEPPGLPGGETKALPEAKNKGNDGPLACPTLPTKGHPQRALRPWLYARLCQAGELTAAQLCAEAKEVHPEYITGTLALLEECELVGPWGKDQLAAMEDESGRGVDARVQDEVRGALADGPLDAPALAAAMKVPTPIILDVLDELREAGRVERRKHLWHQAERVEGAAQ